MGFFGKAQYHQDANNGWEPFSAAEESDDYCAADWARIVRRAERMGVNHAFTAKGLKLSHGDLELSFKDYRGGVKLAERFLDQIAGWEGSVA